MHFYCRMCILTVWWCYLSTRLQSADNVHRCVCEAAASLFWTTALCRAMYFWKHHFRALLSSCTWERAREFRFNKNLIRKKRTRSKTHVLTVAISNCLQQLKAAKALFHPLDAIDRYALSVSLAHFISVSFLWCMWVLVGELICAV